jgi:hypothetical protein
MSTDSMKRFIPWLMAGGRAVLGPVLIAGAECGWNGMTLRAVVVTALVSDVFDGVFGCSIRWRTRCFICVPRLRCG